MDLKRKRIGVLMGGLSAEREVSLRSGANVHEALKRRGYDAAELVFDDPNTLIDQITSVDVVFNCLHGGTGEDGTVQLLLELLNRPYTGSGPLACALAMDKLAAKREFHRAGLPTAPHVEARPQDDSEEAWQRWTKLVEQELGFPCVVKPVREGSSVGVRIAQNEEELIEAARATQREYGNFFVEKFIPGKEITAGILRLEGQDRALPLIELRAKRQFYDYQAKYTPGLTEFVIPARLDEETTRRVQELSLKAHHALGCFGYSRVDLRVTPQGEPYVLEVNTIPGMTETSDLPKAAEAAGISFDELVEHMLKTALERPSSKA
jgi:D-alanine-D-alanine ligase